MVKYKEEIKAASQIKKYITESKREKENLKTSSSCIHFLFLKIIYLKLEKEEQKREDKENND